MRWPSTQRSTGTRLGIGASEAVPLVLAGLLQSKGMGEQYLLSLGSRHLSLVTQPTIHLVANNVAIKYRNT